MVSNAVRIGITLNLASAAVGPGRFLRVSSIRIEPRGEVTLVTIDRPPANAMSPELLEEGLEVAERLRGEDWGPIVLTGVPGYFSAGLDLKIMPTVDEAGRERVAEGINRLFTAWYTLPRPVVAAITGHAIAGGLILALCADYRVAGDAGKFGLTEVKVGVPYPAVALAVVRAELSPPVARRLALGNELFDAEQADAFGLFDERVPDDQVLDRSLAVAAQLGALPEDAYRQTKRDLRAGKLPV